MYLKAVSVLVGSGLREVWLWVGSRAMLMLSVSSGGSGLERAASRSQIAKAWRSSNSRLRRCSLAMRSGFSSSLSESSVVDGECDVGLMGEGSLSRLGSGSVGEVTSDMMVGRVDAEDWSE